MKYNGGLECFDGICARCITEPTACVPAPQKAEEVRCIACHGPLDRLGGSICCACVEFIAEPQWPEQVKPAACVPDDQPDKDLYDWHARAARKKAMGGYHREQAARDDAARQHFAEAMKDILTDKQKQQAESIGRAVANMSRPHDVYMNCGKDWGA